MPGLATAKGYRLGYLRQDVVAGLVLTALLVPAGMGYAEAAGLPAITGLYATIVPLAPTRSSAPRASWCSGRTRRSRPSSPP